MRRTIGRLLATLVAASLWAAFPVPAQAAAGGGVDDASCRPQPAHPDPIVLLHGLGGSEDSDLGLLQQHLAGLGYCTFGLTYGTAPLPPQPLVGGVAPLPDSAAQIVRFARGVLTETGARKVDLVGHSEGAFLSLYIAKTQGFAPRIGRIVAIAPPTHGTGDPAAGLLALAGRDLIGDALDAAQCPACNDVTEGSPVVTTLDTGPIAQPGIAYTIVISSLDEAVSPPSSAFVPEPGVTNEYVQDSCPADPVGHVGEAFDTNVWHLVDNALDPKSAHPFPCSVGTPG